MEHKTLPILDYAKKLKYYYPIDICKKYLTDACNLIKNTNLTLNLNPLEADMMNLSSLNLSKKIPTSKAIMLLGSTLGGQTPKEQNLMLKGIYNSLNDKDILIITYDTTNDVDLLVKAHRNNYLSALTFGSIEYFFKQLTSLDKYLDCFETRFEWNYKLQYLDMFFISKEKLTFSYPDKGIININERQELRGIKSRKYSTEQIMMQLKNQGFIINDIVTNSHKMEMFICAKCRSPKHLTPLA